jgi:hypothetical protein
MKGKKHRLLIYNQVYRPRRTLYLIFALLFVGLYVLPYVLDTETASKLWPPQYDVVFLIVAVIAFLLFLFRLVAPRLAYVQCTERNLRIQTPLYPVVISYRRITTTRPNQWSKVFPPEKITRRQRRLLDKVLGESVLIVDVKGWPVSPGFLKLWMPEVMFSPDSVGLVLWVADWMTLNREIGDFKDRRREAQTGGKPSASLYGRMKQQ